MQKPERIAKIIARAGICSRREAEKLIEVGEVTLDGKRVTTPATLVTPEDNIRVEGKLLPKPSAARLWLYYKPVGLITTHRDEAGRATVFDHLPKSLPRVVSIGRLDLTSEGLLLLTTSGALARHLELPATGWKRRYRVRFYGELTDANMHRLARGITVDGVRYGAIDVALEPGTKGTNHWAAVTLSEGKNREIRKVFEHIGCTVNRLIRISYGPFQLSAMKPGEVKEIPHKTLSEQLGEAVLTLC